MRGKVTNTKKTEKGYVDPDKIWKGSNWGPKVVWILYANYYKNLTDFVPV